MENWFLNQTKHSPKQAKIERIYGFGAILMPGVGVFKEKKGKTQTQKISGKKILEKEATKLCIRWGYYWFVAV